MLLFEEKSENVRASVVAAQGLIDRRDVTVMIPGTGVQVLHLSPKGAQLRMVAFDFERGEALDAQIPADCVLEVIQ